MPRTIHMAAFLPAPPEKLFDMYLDPKFHADTDFLPREERREDRTRTRQRGGQ